MPSAALLTTFSLCSSVLHLQNEEVGWLLKKCPLYKCYHDSLQIFLDPFSPFIDACEDKLLPGRLPLREDEKTGYTVVLGLLLTLALPASPPGCYRASPLASTPGLTAW